MGTRIPNDIIIAALIKHQGWQHKAADEIGCNRRTIERAVKEREKVREVYLELVERRHDKVEAKLQDAIDEGNITAMIFYLKTQAKDRGYVERQEITGADGGPIIAVNWDEPKDRD